MSKFRSIFILASALIWGIALYGIAKIRSDYVFNPPEEPFAINGTIDPLPQPPPPPPPPPDDSEPHHTIKEHNTFVIPTMTPIHSTELRPPIETVASTGAANFQDFAEVSETSSPPNILSPPPATKKCKATSAVKLSQYDISDAYPSEALEKELEGSASIAVSIDDAGNVSGASVVAASNLAFRSTSVAREARSLRFKPAIDDDCNPIASSYTINVVFKL